MSLAEFYEALDTLKYMGIITDYKLNSLNTVVVEFDSVRGEMLLEEFCKEVEDQSQKPKGKKSHDY
jgi:hypothetical protein